MRVKSSEGGTGQNTRERNAIPLRSIGVALALSSLVFPLAGCDSDEEEPAQSSSSSSTRDAATEAKDAGSGDVPERSSETQPDAADASPTSQDSGTSDGGSASDGKPLYVTGSVVFTDDSQLSYVSLLPNLDKPTVDLKQAREFAGWAGFLVSEGKLFVSDGEAPIMTRFAVAEDGTLTKEKSMSFLNYGVEYAGGTLIAPDKALLLAEKGILWNPREMVVTGTFDLPEIADKEDGLEFSGLNGGRTMALRGKRAYLAAHWANWDDYVMSEESLIAVIDTENNEVLKTIPVPCPYLDVASTAEDGYVYFSNWMYSVDQTILQGKRKACTVRLLPGEDELDPDWKLTFADVTDGREGAALQYLGDDKAVFVAYHTERVEDLAAQKEPGELAGLNNWRFWLLDTKTQEAKPIESIDWNAGGFYFATVDKRHFLLVPTADFASTKVIEIKKDGATEERWEIDGWSMDIKRIR